MEDYHRMRFWWIKEKIYIKPRTLWYQDGEVISICPEYRAKTFPIDEFIVEQCSGVKTRGGFSIYDGGIIELEEDEDGSPAEYFEINRIGCAWYCGDEPMIDFVDDKTNIMHDCYKLAGNIHENPELL